MLYIHITFRWRGRRQIPPPLLSTLLLLLLLSLMSMNKRTSNYQTLKHRLSFHVQFLAGETITRGCYISILAGFCLTSEGFKELHKRADGTVSYELNLSVCGDADLCNGSGRLAEMSTLMILLPASLVLLISFFSRL
jgi:hypothetical protein